jgi:hypothetical protein
LHHTIHDNGDAEFPDSTVVLRNLNPLYKTGDIRPILKRTFDPFPVGLGKLGELLDGDAIDT